MTLDRLAHLAKAPFDLDTAELEWVAATLASLTLEEKLGQLLVLQCLGEGEEVVDGPLEVQAGGVTRFFSGDFETEKSMISRLQAGSKVPMLVSADLEGSIMSLPFGTEVPNPLALAAIDDLGDTRTVSALMAKEARAVGVNWSFTPVLDINAAFRSPIVATRGYGADPETIKRHALAQLETFQAGGVAATVKHWPGEGYDDRDQHLVTTVNPLDMDAWHDTFGALYKAAIEAGVKSVMSAHIALPAYVRQKAPEAGVQDQHKPASINALLNQQLLREDLGFNGLIVSDATPMAGLTSVSARKDHLAEVIESGCDMILFTHDAKSDLEMLKEALKTGALSAERLDAALIRILGLKASLGLHMDIDAPKMPEPMAAREMIAPITQKAPTLVKDVQELLPLDPEKHRRVYVFTTGLVSPIFGSRDLAFLDMLRMEGFELTIHDPEQPEMHGWDGHDLVLYVMGEETLLTRERIFMNWAKLTGSFMAAMERPWTEIPTALISFGYPYYLYDAPRMPCVVNTYMAGETAQSATLDCLLGRAPFKGVSPVDPFCGQEIAKY